MTSGSKIYASRVMRLPLVDADGVPIGRIRDLVLAPGGPKYAPYLIGFVAEIQRRNIFVNVNRTSDIDETGVRLIGAVVDFRRYRSRQGEISVRNDILDSRVRSDPMSTTRFNGTVVDLTLQPDPSEPETWEACTITVLAPGLLRRRRSATEVPWRDLETQLFDGGPMALAISKLRELHPSDAAQNLSTLTPEQRRELADVLEDDELAEVLEEMPESEQVAFIEDLEVERAADVIEEMDADDAADLLAELPLTEREEILDAMEPEDALPLRRLLAYQPQTAGGIMTPDPVVMAPTATVAEALARIRMSDVKAIDAAHVYVSEAPLTTPTGRYLGCVGFQRLLREHPSSLLLTCVANDPEPVLPDVSETDIARRLASRDITGIAVCDHFGHLLGSVTVDDVLDHILPSDWRRRDSSVT